jgi:hypothetical protein
MPHALPGPRRLLITWGILMGLTLLSLASAQVTGEGRLAPLAWWSAALVLVATFYKVRQILMVYLNLRVSTATWRGTFIAFLLLTLALIGLGYAVANYLV